MLMITAFANTRVAQAFVEYMATQGVILTIQQHNQSDVWLADESQAERVRAELARFLENPAASRMSLIHILRCRRKERCTLTGLPPHRKNNISALTIT